jgi:hypothetical protein
MSDVDDDDAHMAAHHSSSSSFFWLPEIILPKRHSSRDF